MLRRIPKSTFKTFSQRLLTLSLLFLLPVSAVHALSGYVIGIKGMTCQFCAYGIKRSVEHVPGVASATISLRDKQVRVFLKQGANVSVGSLKQAIVDSGYTPGSVSTIP